MTRRDLRWKLGLAGLVGGGVTGFAVRGSLNSREVIGFANIRDQLLKVAVWSFAGATIFALAGFFLGGAFENNKPPPRDDRAEQTGIRTGEGL